MLTLFGYVFVGLSGARLLLLAATTVLAVSGLHLLRRRPPRRVVSSTWLWAEALGGQRPRAFVGRVRRVAAWFLQLLIALALVVAIGQPRPLAGRGEARTWVLLVDASASMGTKVDGRSRQSEAQARGHRWLEGLRDDDRALVVAFGRRPVAVGGFSNDQHLLAAALDSVQTRAEPGEIEMAIVFALEALRQAPRAEVLVLTDSARDLTDARAAAKRLGIALLVERVGTTADNLAVTGLDARRLTADPAQIEATIGISSYAARPTRAQLALLTVDGRPVASWTVTLAAGTHIERRHSFRDENEVALVAFLQNWEPIDSNALAADDRAFSVTPPVPRRRLLVVGGENLYLTGALLSFGHSVEVKRVDLAGFVRLRDLHQLENYTAVIFDGVTPATGGGRFLFLDPTGAESPFPVRGLVRDPLPTKIARAHPLLTGVSLADLNIRDAHRLQVGPQDQVVVAAAAAPLVVARERPGLRVVALAFDPRRSDLPLRPSFPLLLANSLDWLAGNSTEMATTPSYQSGLTARVPTTAHAAAVIGPDGRRVPAVAGGGALEVPAASTGFYRVVPADARIVPFTFAVNVEIPSESDTRGGSASGRPSISRQRDRLATDRSGVLLILAGALALLEWLWHRRRWNA